MTAAFDLTLTRTIAARPQAVFDAWLDPEALARFMCPAPGTTVPEARSDGRVGGAFLVVMQIGESRLPHRGEYTEIAPHTRLAFTWRSSSAGQQSHVTLDFEAIEPGSTRLTLRHAALPTESARDNHQTGWGRIVGLLADTLT